MKFRALFCFLALALPMALPAAEEAPVPTPKPGLWSRLRHPFGGSKAKEPKIQGVSFRQLEMGLLIEPNPVKLAENRQIKVTLTLTNRGGKLAQLEFPTSQRVEVLLKGKGGQTIEQWSQDQAFNNEPTLVTINPNERLEYSVNVSTRDLVAGETYSVEGFFPNFDALRKARSVTAEK
jgi:hypothetical protein